MKRAADILPNVTNSQTPGRPIQQELPLTRQEECFAQAVNEITLNPGTPDDASYLHAVLCQVGMPRKRMDELTFERRNGTASLLLTAGRRWNGKNWIQEKLPYGPKARLILINLTTYAVLNRTPVVPVGRSTRDFMLRVGLDDQGSEYRSLRIQTRALAVCRMQLGGRIGNRVSQMDAQPIKRFDAWICSIPDQQALWPETVELTNEYYESVLDAAVPLDERAVAALRGSALSLDVYVWLVHRLCRVRDPNGSLVTWNALKVQFGQEYKDLRDLKKQLLHSLHQVLAVYPDAKLKHHREGLVLFNSKPPIPRLIVPGH